MSGSLWWSGTAPSALTKGKSFNSAAAVKEAHAPPRHIPMPSHKFVRVSCGGAHAMALTREGKLFAWGWNEHGQLGVGDPSILVPTPRPIGFFTGRVVGAVACGAAHTLALVASHTGRRGGEVECYAWGAYQAGQLGLPPTLFDARYNPRGVALNTAQPQEVECLRELPGRIVGYGSAEVGAIADAHGCIQPQPLSCGGAHSAMLTKEGGLYTWGANDYGQCGREGSKQGATPGPVHELATDRLVGVACGAAHTLALTEHGRLYSFGLNSTGQLGNGEQRADATPTPQPVRLSFGIAVSSVACGEEFSAAITHDGRLLTWGFGGCGQLGHGGAASLRVPQQVACEPVAQVACGMGHTVARTVNGGLLHFGYTGDWREVAPLRDEARRTTRLRLHPHHPQHAHRNAPLPATNPAATSATLCTSPSFCDSLSCSHSSSDEPTLTILAWCAQIVELSCKAYKARFHDTSESTPAPEHAFDVAAGRSFFLFVGASVAPMPQMHAISIIQHKFRVHELQREKEAQRQFDAAAAIINKKVSQHLARKAVDGAQIEMEQRRQDAAAARIQAYQRMRAAKHRAKDLRAEKAAAASAEAHHSKSHCEVRIDAHAHAGKRQGSSRDLVKRQSTRRVGGGHAMCTPTPPRKSMSVHAMSAATARKSMSGHAMDAATPRKSVSGHAVDAPTPRKSMSGHAVDAPTPRKSMSGHAVDAPTPRKSMSGHAMEALSARKSMSGHGSDAPAPPRKSFSTKKVGTSTTERRGTTKFDLV
ncbi:hypothetical protein AB1Y20_007318 [Prymnesium parvum]|uniref:Uncharacterized protein n=1 Tax=Prymnesium parvum TaxID=97485 RepID=A0AB34IV37_PRYPA